MESIKFVYNTTSAEVLDIYYPYIGYVLSLGDSIKRTDPQLAKYRMVMLLFAHILLEIKLGYIIPVDSSLLVNKEDLKRILSSFLSDLENTVLIGIYDHGLITRSHTP
jgi:hypothetical protein